jgi:flagellar FliJ protein
MRRFKFRLQTVLEQRERIETQAKTTYAEARLALAKAEELLSELNDEKCGLLTELSDLRLSPDFSPDEARMYHEYIQTLTNCIKEQEDCVQILAQNAEAFRLTLVGASQNRQIVDKLREREKESYDMEDNRQDQAATDEMVNARYKVGRDPDGMAA